MGTLLHIIQTRKNCSQTHVWESQPYIGNVPAGNIRLSSAILFVGALPAQAVRLFHVLNCPAISKKSFFRHFLQPAINSVWTNQQKALMASFRQQQQPLVLAGDGSPGHSAKYGSYSVIELTCSKVLDFKLIQNFTRWQFTE